MKNHLKTELSIGLLIVLLAIALLDPLMVFMPGPVAMTVMIILAVLLLAFAAYIWKEKAADEREEYHKLLSGRIAWLVGTGVLMLGILSEGIIDHHVDAWLVLALVAMVLAKIVSRMYAKKNF